MNGQICEATGQELWRVNLKELKARTGMSAKQIADKEKLSEKAVTRFFSGEAKSPSVDFVNSIIHALGGTWREIFGESGAFIGGQDHIALQAEVNRLTEENALLTSNLSIANIDLSVQKDKVSALEAENNLLRLKLEHKEEIISIHNYYNKLKPNN